MANRTTKLLVGGVALLLLFCIGVIIYAAWPFLAGGSGARSEIAKIKARGEPTTLAELASPPIPESENAAPVYAQAFDVLNKANAGVELDALSMFVRRSDKEQNAEAWKNARATATRFDSVIPIVEQAVARPKCRFAVDWKRGLGADLPHTGKLRDLVSIVAASAMIDAKDGRPKQALRKAELCLRMERAIADEPSLASFLSRVSIIRSGVRALRLCVANAPISQSDALRISDMLGRIDLRPQYVRALQGDRVVGIAFFEEMRKKGLNAFSEMAGETASGQKPPSMPGKAVVRALIGPDEKCYIQQANRRIAAARYPLREFVLKRPYKDAEKAVPGYAIFTRMLSMGTRPTRTIVARDLGIAAVDGARTMMAVEAYRGRFGVCPASLNEVSTKLKVKLPKDVFSGRDMVYRRLPKGYLLYGFGPNLKDDGGLVVAGVPRDHSGIPQGDMVWRIER